MRCANAGDRPEPPRVEPESITKHATRSAGSPCPYRGGLLDTPYGDPTDCVATTRAASSGAPFFLSDRGGAQIQVATTERVLFERSEHAERRELRDLLALIK